MLFLYAFLARSAEKHVKAMYQKWEYPIVTYYIVQLYLGCVFNRTLSQII